LAGDGSVLIAVVAAATSTRWRRLAVGENGLAGCRRESRWGSKEAAWKLMPLPRADERDHESRDMSVSDEGRRGKRSVVHTEEKKKSVR
jgi:hypothetical protein